MSSDSNIQDMSGKPVQAADLFERMEALRKGPGGPYDGGMETRVAVLETKVDALILKADQANSDIVELRERMVSVEVKIDHLPSKGFVVTSHLSALVVLAGIITFADDLRRLVSGG